MPGPDYYFFEIGIYRCSVDAHTKEMERAKQKYLKFFEPTRTAAPSSDERAGHWFDNQHWYPWRYNEAIGWLRLYRLGSQIRGELWMAKAKRHVAGGKRSFYYVGKAFELNHYPSQSDEDIRNELVEEVKRISKTPPFKGRYLDLECFLVAAPVLKWRALLGFE